MKLCDTDSIMREPELQDWMSTVKPELKKQFPLSEEMEHAIDRFYFNFYCQSFRMGAFARANCSMWVNGTTESLNAATKFTAVDQCSTCAMIMVSLPLFSHPFVDRCADLVRNLFLIWKVSHSNACFRSYIPDRWLWQLCVHAFDHSTVNTHGFCSFRSRRLTNVTCIPAVSIDLIFFWKDNHFLILSIGARGYFYFLLFQCFINGIVLFSVDRSLRHSHMP